MNKKTLKDIEVFLDRVLVIRFQDDKLGEIVVPEYTKKVSLRGTVVAVGPDCLTLKVGDDIMFGKYAAFEIPKCYEDIRDLPEFLIMNEGDVLLRIN